MKRDQNGSEGAQKRQFTDSLTVFQDVWSRLLPSQWEPAVSRGWWGWKCTPGLELKETQNWSSASFDRSAPERCLSPNLYFCSGCGLVGSMAQKLWRLEQRSHWRQTHSFKTEGKEKKQVHVTSLCGVRRGRRILWLFWGGREVTVTNAEVLLLFFKSTSSNVPAVYLQMKLFLVSQLSSFHWNI